MKIEHRFSFFIFQLAEKMNDPNIHAFQKIFLHVIFFFEKRTNKRRKNSSREYIIIFFYLFTLPFYFILAVITAWLLVCAPVVF